MLANTTTTNVDEIVANKLKQDFLEDFGKSHNVYNTCRKLGISRMLVYFDWQKDPEFVKQFDLVRGVQVKDIEDRFFKEALHDKRAYFPQLVILKNWLPERYGDRSEITQNHTFSLDFDSKKLLSELRESLESRQVQADFSVISPDMEAESKLEITQNAETNPETPNTL